MIFDHIKSHPIIAVLVIYFLLLIFLNSFDRGLFWDENAYLGNARDLIGASNYTEDFRFPLINFLIAGLWAFTGESIFSAKLLIMVFSVLSVFVFYLIAKRYFEKLKSIFIASVFGFSYLILYWSFRVYTDIPGMFFVLLSFYFLLNFDQDKKKASLVASGVSSALAFLMRFPFALFPVSVILYFIYKKKILFLLLFILSLLIALLPWLGYNYIKHSGDLLYDLREQWNIVYTYTTPESPLKHINNLFFSCETIKVSYSWPAFLIPIGNGWIAYC